MLSFFFFIVFIDLIILYYHFLGTVLPLTLLSSLFYCIIINFFNVIIFRNGVGNDPDEKKISPATIALLAELSAKKMAGQVNKKTCY